MDEYTRWIGDDPEGGADLWATLEPRFESLWTAALEVSGDVVGAQAHRAKDALAKGFAGDFSSYEQHLRDTARLYAGLGLSLGAWERVTTKLSDALTPLLIAAHPDRRRLEGALRALTRWLNNSTGVVGTEYVSAANASLRSLAAGIESAREEERKRIAREIHDALGQQLTGFKMDIRWLLRRVADSERDVPAMGEKLQSMSTMIDETIDSVRQLGTDLRPRVLDDLGVGDALEWQARSFEKRSGIRVLLDAPDEELAVDPARSTAVFRCFQELLTNVARHAAAKIVTVRLALENGAIVLEVHDDGRGIADPLTLGSTLGLLGIRERVAGLDGTFSIGPAPAGGTTAVIRMPVSP